MPIIVALVILGSVIFGSQAIPKINDSLKIEPENFSINLTDIEKVEPKDYPIEHPTNSQIQRVQNSFAQPTSNPDPIIDCKIHEKCGGGIRRLKKSDCSNSVCCGLNGNNIFYISRAACTQDQAKSVRKIPITVPTTTSYTDTSEPIVTCQSRGEDLVIPQSLCNLLVDCQIGDEYFLLYPNDCNRLQKQYLEEINTSAESVNLNQNDNQINIQENSECKRWVKLWYDNQYSVYGSTTGTGDFVLKVLEPEYQSKLAECDRLYPI